MMSLRGLKLVTFDVTNTLLKFRVPPWQHYTYVATKHHGFTGSVSDVKDRLLTTYKTTWKNYPNFGQKTMMNWETWWTHVIKLTFHGMLPPCANVDKLAGTLIDEFKTSKCWCLADGVGEILSLMRSHEVLLGVVSNFDPRVDQILDNLGIRDYFGFVLNSYDVGFSKPDKKIFNIARECATSRYCMEEVKPSECLHIGDDLENDYEGARAAGWHALLIATKIINGTPPAPNHVFKNLEDLCLAIKTKKLKLSESKK